MNYQISEQGHRDKYLAFLEHEAAETSTSPSGYYQRTMTVWNWNVRVVRKNVNQVKLEILQINSRMEKWKRTGMFVLLIVVSCHVVVRLQLKESFIQFFFFCKQSFIQLAPRHRSSLVLENFVKFFKISNHIESLDTYIKH